GLGSDAGLPVSGVGDLDAAVDTPGAVAHMRMPPGVLLPYEFAAAMAGRFDGCICWIPIPAAATDACVEEIARRVLRHLPRGHRVIPETSNEVWNWMFRQTHYFATLGRLLGAQEAPMVT